MPALLKTLSPFRIALLGAIRLYRRHLSGRGPFRRVCCTFSQLESCSAFGERMAREASTTGAAILAIARRLRRCRDLSLYRLRNGSLGWGRAHDAAAGSANPDEILRGLDAHLQKEGEGLPVRDAVQRSGLLVAMASGALLARRGRPVDGRNLLIRDGVNLRRRQKLRARNLTLLALAALSAGGILAATGMKMAVIAGCAIFLLSLPVALSALASRGALRRLERIEILSAIEGSFSDR